MREAGQSIIVCAEKQSKYADHSLSVDGADGQHFLNIGPVFGPVEERFENRQIGAGQKRDVFTSKRLKICPQRGLLVEVGGVQEKVDRC